MKHSFSEKFEQHVVQNWSSTKNIHAEVNELISRYISDTDKNVSILEAGTGAGVISFYLEDVCKFKNIAAFDIIPYMIEKAKAKAEKKKSNIQFYLDDASFLKRFKENEFDYLLYLGNVLSMVPESNLNDALLEAFRICKPNGLFMLSFLDWDSRWYNKILSFNINFIRVLTGRKVQKYYLPELKFHNRINWKFYSKDQHPILWVRKMHMVKKLQKIGFEIEAVYKETDLNTNEKGLSIYFVCKKIA